MSVTQVVVAAQRRTLRLGLFVLPLTYSWATYDGYVLPKLLAARALVLALLAISVLRVAIQGRIAVKRTPLDLALLAFVASAALSTLFAYNQNVAVFGTYSRYDGLLTTLTYAALFWLAVQTIESRADARTLLRVLEASAYAVAVIAIVQTAAGSMGENALVSASATLGQKNVLGGFLAMVLPLGVLELVEARSWSGRALAVNVLVVVGGALVLTFSRSAWIGVALALALMVFLVARDRRPEARGVITLVAVILLAGAAGVALASGVGRQDLGSTGDRPAVWADTLKVIASRPLLGYGPDNFGLVFPTFQSVQLQQPWDKAHAEVLQIAATQGLVGVAAYAWMIAVYFIGFWRSGRRLDSTALFAGWLAYQAALQVNFTSLASAFPYWIFSACAFEVWGATAVWLDREVPSRRTIAFAAAPIAAAAAAAAAFGVVLPYLADVHLLTAADADASGQSSKAQVNARFAQQLNSRESVYAVEAGNIAFERGDWAAARNDYSLAADLGTYNPIVYRNLALADRNLGLMSEGEAAARRAVELDRWDPANRALLAEFQVADQ